MNRPIHLRMRKGSTIMSGPDASPSSISRIGLIVLAAMAPAQSWAHPGAGVHADFLQGLAHPVSGIDHLLVMVGVGLFAATLGGRARWALPTAFVAVMALAAIAAMSGLIGGNPWEHLIALSAVLIGVPVALALKPAWPWAIALVASCAIVHGHAHGVELPAAADATAYLAGFVIATALLHATGVLAGIALNRVSYAGFAMTRSAGAAMALAGLVLAFA